MFLLTPLFIYMISKWLYYSQQKRHTPFETAF